MSPQTLPLGRTNCANPNCKREFTMAEREQLRAFCNHDCAMQAADAAIERGRKRGKQRAAELAGESTER